MNFQLYTDAILLTDVPAKNLQAGDIGTIVDRHDVAGLETGYSVEFFDLFGKTVALATLPGSMLRPPTESDRLAVRSDTAASAV